MTPIFGADAAVAQWVSVRVGAPIEGPYTAIGIARGDQLVAGFVYFRNFGHSIDIGMAGEPGWATRGAIRIGLTYPFRQLGVARLQAVVARSNKVSRQFVEAVGFKLEGVLRHGFNAHEDAFLYSMLPGEASRWLSTTAVRQQEHTHERWQGRKPDPARAA